MHPCLLSHVEDRGRGWVPAAAAIRGRARRGGAALRGRRAGRETPSAGWRRPARSRGPSASQSPVPFAPLPPLPAAASSSTGASSSPTGEPARGAASAGRLAVGRRVVGRRPAPHEAVGGRGERGGVVEVEELEDEEHRRVRRRVAERAALERRGERRGGRQRGARAAGGDRGERGVGRGVSGVAHRPAGVHAVEEAAKGPRVEGLVGRLVAQHLGRREERRRALARRRRPPVLPPLARSLPPSTSARAASGRHDPSRRASARSRRPTARCRA